MQRRDFLHGLMAAPMVWPLSGLMEAAAATRRRVVVIGAGAFWMLRPATLREIPWENSPL